MGESRLSNAQPQVMKRLLVAVMLWALPAVAREPLRQKPGTLGELFETPVPKEEAKPPPRLTRFVGDIGFRANAMYLASPTDRLVPGFGGFGHWGVRLTDSVAIVGIANCDLFFSPLGNVTFLSLGPGVRFGERHHLTISAAPELFFFYHPASPFVLATARVDFAYVITESLAAQAQAGFNFGPDFVPMVFLGIGVSWVML